MVAELPGRDARDEVASAAREIRTLPDVAAVSAPQLNRDGDAALLVVTPRSSPQEEATETLVRDLRERVLPSELGSAGIPTYVGGTTALAVDQGDYVADRLPLFVGAVVVLSLLLLIAAFRAPLIAAKAGVMNLLSVGAAFGVIALFAQGGFFGGLIGIDGEVPIAPFVPVLMFAILFGLSMDYEVFLLSRVREEYLRLGSPSDAVTDGLRRTARVITAAAAIMVVVFLAFVVSDDTFLRLIGVGMATAILIDATVVRMALVPAIMQLLGRASWWIPRWLDRIVPRLDHEPDPGSHGRPYASGPRRPDVVSRARGPSRSPPTRGSCARPRPWSAAAPGRRPVPAGGRPTSACRRASTRSSCPDCARSR